MSTPRNRRDDPRSEIQDALFRSLIGRIRDERYPSTTMMDTVEAMMKDEQRADYAEVLQEKIDDDQFPSLDLIRRLSSLAG